MVEERASDGAEVKEVLDIFIIFSMSPVSHLVKDYESESVAIALPISCHTHHHAHCLIATPTV